MSGRPPESILWDFLRGATMTRALGVIADLDVPRRVAHGSRSIDELAAETNVDADALHRVLRTLASDGVFAEDEPGMFRHTDASRTLLDPGWREFAHLFGGTFYRAMEGLDQAVETGRATFAETFGREFWPWLARRPDERAAFDLAMAGGKSRSAERLAELEWRADEVVVDVGGGNGSLLVELVNRRPEVRGIVFDLPETDRDEAALGDRITFVEGDFFERVPTGDSYVLSGILHDWDDERAERILRVINSAARPQARLIAAESVVPPGNEPNSPKWLDLLMLVLAAGRERTESEWRALLHAGGFHPERIEDGLIEARCR